jgi:hypothetical protein
VPHAVNVVGVFDPATSLFTTLDIPASISTAFKFYGCVLAPNGKVPREASLVMSGHEGGTR